MVCVCALGAVPQLTAVTTSEIRIVCIVLRAYDLNKYICIRGRAVWSHLVPDTWDRPEAGPSPRDRPEAGSHPVPGTWDRPEAGPIPGARSELVRCVVF